MRSGINSWTLRIVSVVISILTLGGLSLPPAHAASGQITAEMLVGFNGSTYYSSAATPDLEIPSGQTVDGAVNYACINIDCLGGSITITIPSNVTVTNVTYAATDVSSVSINGSSRTFSMKDLTAGMSGQITFKLTMPSLTIPDNTALSVSVDTSTESGASNMTSADLFEFNLRSGSNLTLVINRVAGGSINVVSKYVATACNAAPENKGPIQVTAGSTISITLPAGASDVSTTFGTYDAVTNTITATIASAVMPPNCASFGFFAYYNEPDFAVGDEILVAGIWTGQLAPESADRTLATDDYDHSISAPNGEGSGGKTAYGPRAPIQSMLHDTSAGIGDTALYEYNATNSGNVPWDSFELTDNIPDGYRTNRIYVNNKSETPGELWIKSNYGLDGLDGSPDDNVAFKIADVPLHGVTIDVYDDAIATGLPLDPTDDVTFIELTTGGVAVAESATILRLTGKVKSNYFNGNPVVPNVDSLKNTISASANSSIVGEIAISPDSAWIDVDIPVLAAYGGIAQQGMSWSQPWDAFNDWWPYLSNTVWSPHIDDSPEDGVISNSERSRWVIASIVPQDLNLANPVISVVLPKNVTMTSFVPCSVARCAGLTGAELRTDYPNGYAFMPKIKLTQVDDYDGTGKTLLRFEVQGETTLAVNNIFSIWLNVNIGFGTRGVLQFEEYFSAQAGQLACRSFSQTVVDTYDTDGDGQTIDTVCRALGSIALPTIYTGSVTAQVKGSYDLGFNSAPNSGYTSPGGNDILRAKFTNAGTDGLTNTLVATTFARPGDDGVVTSIARNASVDTFPMHLTGEPTLEGVPNEAIVDFYWTTETNPCLPEIGNWNPAGCTSANWQEWDAVAPTNPQDVTAMYVDFGANVSEPGDAWYVNFPVTTPTSGANESSYAVPSETDIPADYETASASFAFVTTPYNLATLAVGLPLSKSESTTVNLAMPSSNGPQVAPTPEPYSSVDYKGKTQSVTVAIPANGYAKLLNPSGAEVDTLTVTGVGTYTIDSATGVITFTPRPTYVGWPSAIPYRVYNYFGQSGDSTYRARVIVGTAIALPLTSSSYTEDPQDSGIVVPSGATVKLINSSGTEVTTLFVPGKGTFEVDPDTQAITFTPVPGFIGNAQVSYRIIASDNSTADNYYYASVLVNPNPSYVLSFDSQLGTSVDPINFYFGNSVAEPEAPTREGYIFGGWSETIGGEPVTWNYSPPTAENRILYALWTAIPPNVYVATFNSQGGTSVTSQTFLSGEAVEEPADSFKDGFRFLGWSLTEDGELVDFDYYPTDGDIDFYARWAEIYTANFNSMGGSAIDSQEFISGEAVSEPQIPTRSGFRFLGWSLTQNGESVDFNYSPSDGDITFYALWEPDTEVVQYKFSTIIYFDGDKADLRTKSKAKLRKLFNKVLPGAFDIRVLIQSSVKKAKSEVPGNKLARMRATSVELFLKKLNLQGSYRLVTDGKGRVAKNTERRAKATVTFLVNQ